MCVYWFVLIGSINYKQFEVVAILVAPIAAMVAIVGDKGIQGHEIKSYYDYKFN